MAVPTCRHAREVAIAALSAVFAADPLHNTFLGPQIPLGEPVAVQSQKEWRIMQLAVLSQCADLSLQTAMGETRRHRNGANTLLSAMRAYTVLSASLAAGNGKMISNKDHRKRCHDRLAAAAAIDQ
jgi:hypothetical protein